jgi:hypothetical protein
MSEPTVDELIAAYITLRDVKTALKIKYEARAKIITDEMTKLEGQLQEKMNELNVNALPTDAGTAYKVKTESATVSDMDALLDYVRENDAWHLLEKRVSKTGVRAILDENQPLPPGVNWYTSTAVNIRKPNER